MQESLENNSIQNLYIYVLGLVGIQRSIAVHLHMTNSIREPFKKKTPIYINGTPNMSKILFFPNIIVDIVHSGIIKRPCSSLFCQRSL